MRGRMPAPGADIAPMIRSRSGTRRPLPRSSRKHPLTRPRQKRDDQRPLMLERYIARDLFCQYVFSLQPDTDEPLIRHMATAAAKADVGPMATVAGAIASAGIEAMMGAVPGSGVIDNGGDIALVSDRMSGGCPCRDSPAFRQGRVCDPATKKNRLVSAPHRPRSALPSRSGSLMRSRSLHPIPSLPMRGRRRSARIRTDDRSVLSQFDPVEVQGVFAILGEMSLNWLVWPAASFCPV